MEAENESGEVEKKTAEEALSSALRALATAATKLSARSRGIPSGEDFHFYRNFPEFGTPARDLASVAGASLEAISDSAPLLFRSRAMPFPASDHDDAHDWLVNVNDELLERFGASMDEFKELRAKQEEKAKGRQITDDNGFQLVTGKNNKKKGLSLAAEDSVPGSSYAAAGVTVATKERRSSNAAKPKVPFHIPSIPRPQDEYRIIVNNANTPFQHVWLEQNEDGTQLVHPLKKMVAADFGGGKDGIREPVKPLSLEETPFTLVEELKDLREMCAKLKSVTEFAVDLEHNQYRSFQGLTCLMQISTRTEDFIVDTLKLRIYIGSYLREVFKDPCKRKVMHGADRDILWLQRDFGIYVVNLFDTGQASRVLQLERNSLEYLLHHFCNVEANKEYQNADWRLRPLPKEMVKYAREDTHYLLYIYDVMRNQLLSESINGYDFLLEVYNRSSELCLQMYEKELLTDTSFLNIYGVQDAELNAQQLSIVSGLCHWRDYVARSEDESTGYILPNKTLLEIAKEMPRTSEKLLQLIKSRHSVVERYLPVVLDIIRNSISQSSAFESIVMKLKQAKLEKAEAAEIEAKRNNPNFEGSQPNIPVDKVNAPAVVNFCSTYPSKISSHQEHKHISDSLNMSEVKNSGTVTASQHNNNISSGSTLAGAKVASVQMLKRPAAFGALFGKPSSSGKIPSSPLLQQEDAKIKVEKIKQAVALPFNFSVREKKQQQPADITSHEMVIEAPLTPSFHSQTPISTASITMEDIIPLEDKDTNSPPPSSNSSPNTKNPNTPSTSSSSSEGENTKQKEWFPRKTETTTAAADSDSDSDSESEMPVSPTELSSNFEKCFKSLNKPLRENSASVQVKPFDYESARKDVKFGEPKRKGAEEEDDEEGGGGYRKPKKNSGKGGEKKNSSKRGSSGEKGKKEGGGFQHPRRRQAFPLSGNRSITYT